MIVICGHKCPAPGISSLPSLIMTALVPPTPINFKHPNDETNMYPISKLKLIGAKTESVRDIQVVSVLLHTVIKLGAKDAIPELAGNAKAELIIEEVVSKVMLLELLVPQGEVLVVKEVVCKIIADVTEDAAAVDSGGSMPAVGNDGVGKVPERGRKHDEEGRGHDESVLVHG